MHGPNVNVFNIKIKKKKGRKRNGGGFGPASLFELFNRYLGETVTIYTESGGESGLGFTGVLLELNKDYIRLLTQVGPVPACSLGSCCTFIKDDNGEFNSCNNAEDNTIIDSSCIVNNTLGSITNIPICKIVAFVHNAV